MPVAYEWENDEKTIIGYTLSGDDWNWTDYHKTVRMSMFALVNLDHSVHVIADFRDVTRFPGGAIAHLRTLGKKQHQNFSGVAVAVGLPTDLRAQLSGATQAEKITVGEQIIYFAEDKDAAHTLLNTL